MCGFRRQRDTKDHQKKEGGHIEGYGPRRFIGQYKLCCDKRRGRVAEYPGELKAERSACTSHAGFEHLGQVRGERSPHCSVTTQAHYRSENNQRRRLGVQKL